MYDELVKRLKESEEKLSRATDAIPHVCECCIGCEVESGGCDNAFALSPKRAKEYLSMPHWIPVTERLPENLTSVIVHRKDGGIFIWEYFDTSQTDECWIDDSMNVYSFYDVTHWMPLPEPPKEET